MRVLYWGNFAYCECAIWVVVTTERNKLEISAVGTAIHGTTKRRITTVDHFFDIFHLRRSGMKSIFNFFIIVGKDSL